ncbi:FKBP-type peptidyl-prolyl cis-trans isomerase SlyD [Methanosarcina thermophila]|jgi:FKBP-type peptidyl-prolyl cis-trans isomerase 2|uniref:Peptidyl-prolyl cis-trans isomerase n=4 Tax=Methanosarcina thermophila TaxID=2210 RepID=A0A0E3HA20_METTE|nr:peptidylprolyl isomerase [Methanosarcina thermophila]AKB14272.1 FKBP-type peptidyl-prolyl cis-trans isomerase SlyD [Methanosarcina thermophila TM-1]AKB15089.1 FKBP-type peptidyl-prolyl cis-trans isomerase SlyD [Methanosarcina thermophila CHTI-55]NLU56190.1 peptidylprolyl isomerase [Methanosarcina thermophila]SFT69098.1 FKBP-type peptidyl-prolyl cis-trans isomerase SlyD [Methanosarcina thermophila]
MFSFVLLILMAEDIPKETSKTIEKGDTISVDYVGRLEDGTIFDTSIKEAAIDAGIYNQMREYKPLTFTVGAGQMIKGFDEGVIGMKKGEEKTITIPPEEAYGEYREEFARELSVDTVDFTPEIGMRLATDSGLTGTVTEVSNNSFVVDFNHPLAGKTLIFDIKLVSIE